MIDGHIRNGPASLGFVLLAAGSAIWHQWYKRRWLRLKDDRSPEAQRQVVGMGDRVVQLVFIIPLVLLALFLFLDLIF